MRHRSWRRRRRQRHYRPEYIGERRHPAARVARGVGRVSRLPFPAALAIGVATVAVTVVVVSALLMMLAMAATLALPLLITIGLIKLVLPRRRRAVPRSARRQLRDPAPQLHLPAPADLWPAARSEFIALRRSYADYECDALAVLRLPALADVTVPSTARFIEAFAEAQALDTDTSPPPEHRAQYVAAVDKACRAWRAAREAAERLRTSHLSAAERSTVERVVRLLTTARDTDNDAERQVAYNKARNELARLERTSKITLPRVAKAKLDAAARGELPPAADAT